MFKKYAPFIESRQTELLIKLTGIFWLFEKLIGWRVWTAYRLFPTAPVFTFLDAVPGQVHLVLFIAELALILWLIFFDVITPVPAILLSCEILLCLLDQNRLQPYEYQCIITLFVLIINRNNRAAIPVAIAFILAATYFYSGIGKFNQGFLKGVWEGMILADFFKVPFRIRGLHWVYLSGYLPGFAELAAGLGLLFPGREK